MTIRPHRILTGIICLLLISASAQDNPKECPKPVTESQKLMGTVLIKNQQSIQIAGQATFTITALNADNSLEGIFTYTLLAEDRKKLAQSLNKSLPEITTTTQQMAVIGQFRKETECPVLQLNFPSMEIEISGKKVKLERFTLNLKKTDDGVMIHLCAVARQMNRGIGRPPVRRVNELLNCQKQP